MLQIEHNGKKWVATLSIDQKKKVIDAGFLWDDRENVEVANSPQRHIDMKGATTSGLC